MTNQLTEQIKLEYGYTEEEPGRCDICKHSREAANAYVDRSWDVYCDLPNVANLPSLTVKPEGRCKHFQAKDSG